MMVDILEMRKWKEYWKKRTNNEGDEICCRSADVIYRKAWDFKVGWRILQECEGMRKSYINYNFIIIIGYFKFFPRHLL
jgi:hypothetical protein